MRALLSYIYGVKKDKFFFDVTGYPGSVKWEKYIKSLNLPRYKIETTNIWK